MPPDNFPGVRPRPFRRVRLFRQWGFTLLEAMVAITILGVTFSMVLAGVGGVGRTSSRAHEHVVAQQLAASLLDQFAINQLDQVNDVDDLVYNGVKYGYKLKFDSMDDSDLFPIAALRSGRRLKTVRIEVFWGNQPNLQSYALSTVLFR